MGPTFQIKRHSFDVWLLGKYRLRFQLCCDGSGLPETTMCQEYSSIITLVWMHSTFSTVFGLLTTEIRLKRCLLYRFEGFILPNSFMPMFFSFLIVGSNMTSEIIECEGSCLVSGDSEDVPAKNNECLPPPNKSTQIKIP